MSYGYDSYDSALAGLLGGFSVALIILVIFVLAWAVVSIIALWKVYKKAGKGGWECIVPFYSYYVLAEIAGLNWWWFLLAVADSILSLLSLDDLSTIATLVSIFARFNIYYNIAKKFNKTNGTAVCAGIFSGIFILIFGFSKEAIYDTNVPVSKNGVFGTPEMPTNAYNNQNNVAGQTVYNNTSNVVNPMTGDTNVDVSAQESNANTNVNSDVVQEFSFCGNCGTKLNKDVKFCPNCGKENR